jgi:hypothetical protein
MVMCILTEDLDQQSPLERWIEFQDYQLARLEGFEKKRDALKKELTEGPVEGDDVDAIPLHIESLGRRINRHMVLMHWIEQQRQLMFPGGNAATASNGTHTAAEKTTLRHQVGLQK